MEYGSQIVYTTRTLTVELHMLSDEEGHPSDFKCYSPADLAAWERDEWTLVGVRAVVTHVPTDAVLGKTEIFGVEHGALADSEIDAFDLNGTAGGLVTSALTDAIARAPELESALSAARSALAGGDIPLVEFDPAPAPDVTVTIATTFTLSAAQQRAWAQEWGVQPGDVEKDFREYLRGALDYRGADPSHRNRWSVKSEMD